MYLFFTKTLVVKVTVKFCTITEEEEEKKGRKEKEEKTEPGFNFLRV